MINLPRCIVIQKSYVKGAWTAFASIAMTSEKFRMVTMPLSVPTTAVVPWRANKCPRRSTGIQQSGSGRVLSKICQEIQPVDPFQTRVPVLVCEA
jgi:hypothetical protein